MSRNVNGKGTTYLKWRSVKMTFEFKVLCSILF